MPSLRFTLRRRPADITVRTLVSRITAAGGELTIQDPEPAVRAAWRRAFHAATNKGGLPAGMRLRHTGRDSGDLIVRLVPDIPANQPVQPQPKPVPVPRRLERPHPVVAALARRPERLAVSADVVQRALRILHALFTAAEARGWLVEACGHDEPTHGRVAVRGHAHSVAIAEELLKTPHVPTDAELAEAARRPGFRIPEHDYIPSGRLTISLPRRGVPGTTSGRRRCWSDRNRWRLDHKLGHVLSEIERRAALDDKKEAEEAARRAAEWRRFDQAWVRLRTEHRAARLREHVESLRFADAIRGFRAEVGSSPSANMGVAADEWLAWAAVYADEIDPRLHPPHPPEDPRPDFDALAPHLEGDWSVHEQHQRWREWRQQSEIGRRFPEPDDLLLF